VEPETEGSSPCLQDPATVFYPEPGEPIPNPPRQSPHDPIFIIFSIYASVFRVFSLLRTFPPEPCALFLLSNACQMLCSLHSPWYYRPNDIWGWAQIMNFSIVQIPLFSRCFFPLRSKYPPQHFVLKHPEFMVLP
jgi:hypothetical protein